MSRKKKIIAVIALCVLTFALDIVLTVYGPWRSYPTLQEAVEADGLFKDYPEMLARSDTENYTLVAAGSDGSKSERSMNFSVFRKTDKGWRAPSQAIYPHFFGPDHRRGGRHLLCQCIQGGRLRLLLHQSPYERVGYRPDLCRFSRLRLWYLQQSGPSAGVCRVGDALVVPEGLHRVHQPGACCAELTGAYGPPEGKYPR